MICKHCNSDIEDELGLCPNCGMEPTNWQLNHKKTMFLYFALSGAVLLMGIAAFFLLWTKGEDSLHSIKKIPLDDSNLYVTPPLETIAAPSPTAALSEDFIFTTVPSRPLPNLFYVKDNNVYHVSGEIIKPSNITTYPFSWHHLFLMKVSEDGSGLLYTENADPSKEHYYADLNYSDLTAERIRHLKIDSGVNSFTMNQDGSLIYYLKNNELYVNDLQESRKLADKVNEFYINKMGDKVLYRTSDQKLYLYSANDKVRLLDSEIYLKYASEDLKLIYYFKNDSLYLLKDYQNLLLIDSGLRVTSDTIVSIYEDGSVYYLKPRQLTAADYVTDDLADADAGLMEVSRSAHPDEKSYTEARLNYQEKVNRDKIREALKNSDYRGTEVNSLYYYSEGASTLISDLCMKAWRYSEEQSLHYHYRGSDQPILAYQQLKPDQMKLSEAASYEAIMDFISSSGPSRMEHYICRGEQVLGKFVEGEIYHLIYHISHQKIYYLMNYFPHSSRGDLYSVAIDGPQVREGGLYEEKVIMYDPSCYAIGSHVVYLKNGSNKAEDFILYVDHTEIDQKVTGWTHKIKNSDAFLYLRDFDDHKGRGIYTNTLHLYKDGKSIILSENVTSFSIIDEDTIAYTTGDDDRTIRLFLYDGSDTRLLIDTYSAASSFESNLLSPLEDFYYSYQRKTVE